jgi:hypothetical protein
MQNTAMEDLGLGTSLRTIGVELQQGFRLRKWIGLALVLVGIVVACVGGVFLGMFIYGHPTGTAAVIFLAVGLAIAVIGNLIWQRARILTRRNLSGG